MDKKTNIETIIEQELSLAGIYKLAKQPIEDIDYVSTGIITLDKILGRGIPRGRIIEIYGTESSGKTTLMLHVIAQFQKLGLDCGFIDAEHALDVKYAKAIGVDTDSLYFVQPDTAEDALQKLESMASKKGLGCVVLDSVAALVPRVEIEGDMGDAHIGVVARLMGQALRKIVGIAKKNNVTIIFINQLRDKIGVYYGSAETTTGGKSLRFYATQRIDMRKKDVIKTDGSASGNMINVKIIKNKVAPPLLETRVKIAYGEGIDKETSLIDAAVLCGVMEKKGSWFVYQDAKEQGTAGMRQFLMDNPELYQAMEKEVRAAWNM